MAELEKLLKDAREDFIHLENISCYDADGNIFEHYPELDIRKDVFRTDQVDQRGNKEHQDFTSYQAIVHCEQQGLFLPSFALSCNIIEALYRGSSDPEFAKVLEQYRDYGPDYGWHAQNTVVHWGRETIIHYPQESDFPAHGGQNRINNNKDKKQLEFKNARSFTSLSLTHTSLNPVLCNNEYLRYLKNLTGLRDPFLLVDIGKYFQRQANIKVSVSSSDRARATLLGCSSDYYAEFDLSANVSLSNGIAARGVRAQ